VKFGGSFRDQVFEVCAQPAQLQVGMHTSQQFLALKRLGYEVNGAKSEPFHAFR
jgi:hypothetical protein